MATATRAGTPLLSTLPGRYYHDPAIYEQERERIFERMWVCAGRAERAPRPGDYFAADLGRESVLVVRGRDGALRAFLNVCRHRGARLCAEGRGHLKGALRCRYHGWTYGLDGRLLAAPNLGEAEGFDRGEFGLWPVALAVWEGLVWLSLADEPEPLAAGIGRALVERFGDEATFARYHVGELKVARTIEYDVRANWKLLVENFLECYHCGPLHPELCRLLPGFRGGLAYQVGQGTEFADGVEAFTFSGSSNRPPLPHLQPEDRRRYQGVVLRPNVFVNLLPDHVVLHTLRPQAPDRTRVTCDWLFDAEVMARSDFDPQDAVEVFDLVNRQDWEVCELAQLGTGSRAYRDGGVYVPIEHHIRRFIDGLKV